MKTNHAISSAAIGLLAASLWWGAGPALAQESMCARVVIEISQELTLERQAFDAHMKINNGAATRLDNVDVDVAFEDALGQPVVGSSDSRNTNAAFYIRVDSMQNIGDVNGNGTVAAGAAADIHWLIIPSPGAGGQTAAGQLYYVGATLKYTISGEENVTQVTPDHILVKPMPMLALDYFIPNWVYGDDAFTQDVEPPVPFPLGVRVKNAGYGKAVNLKIASGQPRIIENERGLLIGFEITGSEVNGKEATKSLTADFGTIDPAKAKVAAWTMECTLSGEFKEFEARFSHADELGGELTSLIGGLNTHHLVHRVLVDLPGRDAILDFLTDDQELMMVYESDNVDTGVTNLSVGSQLTAVNENRYRLGVPPASGAFYCKKELGAGVDGKEFNEATRILDGKTLHAANVWFSKERDQNNRLVWHHYLNVFDINGGGDYEFGLKDRPVPENVPPVLQYVGTQVVREGEQLGFIVQATDLNRTLPALTAVPLPPRATFTNNLNGTGIFHWWTQPGDYGVYPVRFIASDGALNDWEIVKIYVGHPGEALNARGIPESLGNWSVEIAELKSVSSSGNSTVQWDSVNGLYYDLYVSDNPYSGSMSWNRSSSTRPGSGFRESIQDAGLGTNRNYRFYKMVLAGDSPDTNKVWGVIRKNLAPGYTMISPPVRTDRRFDGEMGFDLAEELQGRDGGIGSGADEVYILQTNGTWRTLYLDAGGAWRESNGQESTYELPAGLGLWVARKTGTPARTTFTGPVGNDGTQAVTLQPGFNLIGLSEGKNLPLAQTLATANPQGGAIEEIADQLVIQKPNGSWRRLMYVQGWGAPYDGNWFDLSTYQVVTTNEVLEPGAAYYYLRRGEATDVEF
jgi:hypothetical protein